MRTTEDLMNYITEYADFDEQNYDVIKMLCEYFGNDEHFTQFGEGFSLQKGLFISGNIGCGKTYLMNLLTDNLRASYVVKNCRDIASAFAMGGDEAIDKYCNICDYVDRATYKRMRDIYPYCFDDLGTEPDKKYYGTDSNVMLEILISRYSKGDFTHTHITTNLSADEPKLRYGSRLTSRFKEMFNFINFPPAATDRRK
jgi:DNA replication protein DnaC